MANLVEKYRKHIKSKRMRLHYRGEEVFLYTDVQDMLESREGKSSSSEIDNKALDLQGVVFSEAK